MVNIINYHVSCTDWKISFIIIYFYYLFFHRRPIQCCVFFPVGLSSLMKIQHPTSPIENAALTTKGLQERKHNIVWDDGGKIGNKNK